MSDMIKQQQAMANYMAAVTQLLTGASDRHQDFIGRVALALGGSAVNLMTLLSWGENVRRTGRPIIHFSPSPEVPKIPLVSLVAHVDGQLRVIENCMLTLGSKDRKARLVPDGFKLGAYEFDDRLELRHIERAPAKTFLKAQPDMVRAYDRLLELEAEQWARGGANPLPTRFQMKKAA